MWKRFHEHPYVVTDIIIIVVVVTFVYFDRERPSYWQDNCRLMTDWSRHVGTARGVSKQQPQRDPVV
jgi:hypothetical protein